MSGDVVTVEPDDGCDAFERIIFFDAEFVDGGSSSGVWWTDGEEGSFSIDDPSDNNDAEWLAAIEAVKEAKRRGWRRFECVGDSRLVVEQMNGRYGADAPANKYAARRSELQRHCADLVVRWRWTARSKNRAGRSIANRQRRERYAKSRPG
jgi:ribonuclease HI